METRKHNSVWRAASAAIAFMVVANVGLLTAVADEPPAIAIDYDAATCPAELTDQFVEELRLRTEAPLFATPTNEDQSAQATMRLRETDQDSCEIRLNESDDSYSVVVANDADSVEIASGANRLAWIIDGSNGSKTASRQQDDLQEQEPSEINAAVSRGMAIVETAVADTSNDAITDTTPRQSSAPTRRRFNAEIMAGATSIPSAEAVFAALRAKAGWRPRPWLQLGLIGRVPLSAVRTESGGTRYSYRPWSLDLTAGYVHPIGPDLQWNISGGLRATISQISATELTNPGRDQRGEEHSVDTPATVGSERDSSWRDTLARWSAVMTVGASYSVLDGLALRLDATAAMSPSRRRLHDEQRLIVDLGHFDLDLLLGLQWRF